MSRSQAFLDNVLPESIDHIEILGISVWTLTTAAMAMIAATVIAITIFANMKTNEGTSDKPKERDPNLPKPSEIVSLRIYPIKSCRGFEIKKSMLKKTGLDLDRNWMFVDVEKKKFLTIRSDPSMTLIDTGLTAPDSVREVWTELRIGIRGTAAHVNVPCYPTKEWLGENCKLTEVEIWGEKTDAWAYSDEINKIFSDFFKKAVLLVYKGPTPRMSGGNADAELYGKQEPHHFADVMSLQVASEASLEDLNRRLKEKGQEPLTIERFRPNIIIKGNEPWEEDRWKRVRINTTEHSREMLWRVPLDVLARCARCQVPNVNPDTAEKHAKEPWETLMTFRRVDPGGVAKYKPCFGMLCMPTKGGVIQVGSELEVLELTEKHLYNTAKFEEL